VSTIFIKVNESACAVIKEYTEVIFINNESSITVYNLFNIENTGDVPISDISVYTPYKIEEIASNIITDANKHSLNRFLADHTEIVLGLSPLQINRNAQLTVELSYVVNYTRQETEHGYLVPLLFYNTNYIKCRIQNGALNLDTIPSVDKTNLCLAIACSSKYTFPVIDSTPCFGNVLDDEDKNVILDKAIQFINPLNSGSNIWAEYLMWCSPQLADLTNPVIPAESGRTVKTYFTRIKSMKIGPFKFTYPDIINLLIGIASFIIGVIGIYLTIYLTFYWK